MASTSASESGAGGAITVGVGAGEAVARHRHNERWQQQRSLAVTWCDDRRAVEPARMRDQADQCHWSRRSERQRSSTDNGGSASVAGAPRRDGWRWRLCIAQRAAEHIGAEANDSRQCGSRHRRRERKCLIGAASASGNCGSVAVGSGNAAGGSAGTVTVSAGSTRHRQSRRHFNHRWCARSASSSGGSVTHADGAGSATSSEIAIASGAGGSNGVSGDAQLATGDAGAGDTGSVTIASGDATSGRTGNIVASAGTSDRRQAVVYVTRRRARRAHLAVRHHAPPQAQAAPRQVVMQ